MQNFTPRAKVVTVTNTLAVRFTCEVVLQTPGNFKLYKIDIIKCDNLHVPNI